MPTPSIRFGPECREPMQRGFDTLARLLALTLGPRGGKYRQPADRFGRL